MAQIMDTGLEGFATLGADINKNKKDDVAKETSQGIVSDKIPELTLEMSDEEIIKLTTKWEKSWKDSPNKTDWDKQCTDNENYWRGIQFDTLKADKNRPMVDNLVFEALETFLPQATRRNPEPLTTLHPDETTDPTKESYLQHVKFKLAYLADKNKLRLKLKKGLRHWAIYQIGVAKFGWDVVKDMPILRIVRPKKMILDPEATIDEDGYTGNHIGEYRKMEASKILEQLDDESKKKIVKDLVKDNLSTDVQFIEWWTPKYMCWQLGKDIILKKKNPHWNYDRTENPAPIDLASEGVQVDEVGNITTQPIEIKGINHFSAPEMPYKFLSIFNLGDQPMDKTSLINQNLSNQDLINKRNKQIDKNADSMNGGIVVSLGRSGLTQAQAKGVTEALRKGGTIVIPDGAPREAVDRYPAPGLPNDVYNQLNDARERFRDIFGIRGSSAAGLETEKTVRGKYQNRQTDTDRIGGGVTEYLEQFADDIFIWFLQMLYVYDDKFQFVNGNQPPKIEISVKEGSLLPKDSLTLANQAIDLASAGKMSLLDLYKKLEYPNPEELAVNAWLEINAPEVLYANDPRIAQVMQSKATAAAGARPPSESISFKDLPPSGQIQLAAKAGITLQPDEIAANEATKTANKASGPLPNLEQSNNQP